MPLPGQDPFNVPPHGYMTVDQMPGDKSPYGVYGMAGNVSEWTDTLTNSTRIGSVKVAVIRGRQLPDEVGRARAVDLPHHRLRALDAQYWLGFRCASNQPPAAK